ncbi:MAG: Maf family protein [Thermoleophilaceae bacterium]
MLVLASRSPQRRAILTQLGVPFTVEPPDVEERTAGPPRELVSANAVLKARAVPGSTVLGVDTVVSLDGQVLGKPRGEEQARSFLAALSGREHEVWSALALIDGDDEQVAAAVTAVRLRELDERDVAWYLATGEWRGRAGGYAIQAKGAALVERVRGDYYNVVGLPVAELMRLRPALLSAGHT